MMLSYLTNFSQNSLDSLKATNYNQVKSRLNLNDLEFSRVLEKDSLLIEIQESINDSIDSKKIKRRLDSFFSSNYSLKKTILVLKLDRYFRKGNIEFDEESNERLRLEFDSFEEMKLFFDSTNIEMKIKLNDSSKTKNTDII